MGFVAKFVGQSGNVLGVSIPTKGNPLTDRHASPSGVTHILPNASDPDLQATGKSNTK